MDLFGLMNILATLETCKEWLRNKGLLVTPGIELRCNNCQQYFKEIKRGGRIDYSKLRCCCCKKERSIRVGSFFSKSHLDLRVLVALMFMFAYRAPVRFVETVLGQAVSRKVIIEWFSAFRGICSRSLLAHPVQLGGTGCIVEIGRCMLKRKSKSNRGQWVFGAWDRHLGKGIVWPVPNTKRKTLLPFIKHHILPGTHIYSDGARSYATLGQEGYHHDVINEQAFVACNDFGVKVHTNSIKGFWGNIKIELKRRRGLQKEKLPRHLDELMYRQHRRGGDMMDYLIEDMLELYPVPTEIQ